MKRLAVCAVLVFFMAGYSNADTWTALDYPGAVMTSACGISGNTTVGYYFEGNSGHGFSYNDGIWTSFNYPGADYTYAYGIMATALLDVTAQALLLTLFSMTGQPGLHSIIPAQLKYLL